MTFPLYDQCNATWRNHPYGYGPGAGTLCAYDCLGCCFAGIASDTGHALNPPAFDESCDANHLYVGEGGGLFDLLNDGTLDSMFPGEYTTTHFAGFRADVIAAAIPAPDKYVILHIEGYAPIWKMVVGHFVMGWTVDGAYIGDVQGGVQRTLASYGGPGNVTKTILVDHHPAAPTPAPPPPPPVQPPPPPTFMVTMANGTVVIASGLAYDAAVASAKFQAADNVGQLYEVRDETGKTVLDTEFVALPPAPVPPGPLPQPIPNQTHPMTFWDYLDRFLVGLVLAIKYRGTRKQK